MKETRVAVCSSCSWELLLALCVCWQVAYGALALLVDVTSTVAAETAAEFTVQKHFYN